MFVKDVPKDLGLDVKRLVCGRAHFVLDSNSLYVALNEDKGHIIANDKIDRETCQEVTLQL